MNTTTVLNFIFFQMLWFASVVGAGAYDLHWLACAALLPITVLAWRGSLSAADFALATVAVLVGMSLDNAWVQLGILAYPGYDYAPYWIGFLWYGLALTINHSMAFFRDQRWLGPIIVGLFAPVTYLTGERFGAVTVLDLGLTSLICVSWFVLFIVLTQVNNVLLSKAMVSVKTSSASTD